MNNIGHYIVMRDGKEVAKTRSTQYPATVPGEYVVIGVAGDGTQSFMSEPCSNQPTVIAEMPGEGTGMVSKEISYQPQKCVSGYHGVGFVEIDHHTAPVQVEMEIKEAADYAFQLVYSNGNGPVNTENKCAVRTILVDGQKAGVAVMPHRGVANWDDWGTTNAIEMNLSQGKHTITIEFRPEDENMNLGTNHALVDRVLLTKL